MQSIKCVATAMMARSGTLLPQTAMHGSCFAQSEKICRGEMAAHESSPRWNTLWNTSRIFGICSHLRLYNKVRWMRSSERQYVILASCTACPTGYSTLIYHFKGTDYTLNFIRLLKP